MGTWRVEKKAEGLYSVGNGNFGFTFAHTSAVKGGSIFCTYTERRGKQIVNLAHLNPFEAREVRAAQVLAQDALTTYLKKKTAAP